MPNLLPPKEKAIIFSLYRTRMIILALFFLSVLVVIAGALLLPSYLLTMSKLKGFNDELALMKESVSYKEGKNTEAEIAATQSEVRLINPIMKNNEQLDYLMMIEEERASGIAISALNFRKMSEKESEISISGTARDRNALLNYQNRLKEKQSFKSVDLPISNLANNENISFNIKITLENVGQ